MKRREQGISDAVSVPKLSIYKIKTQISLHIFQPNNNKQQPTTNNTMGLDQYAYTRDKDSDTEEKLIQQWRKHNALQGWMEMLWNDKGLEGSMNCRDMSITLEDLLKLEDVIHDKALPKTEGFFYGSDTRECEFNRELDLEFLGHAYDALRADKEVIYNANW